MKAFLNNLFRHNKSDGASKRGSDKDALVDPAQQQQPQQQQQQQQQQGSTSSSSSSQSSVTGNSKQTDSKSQRNDASSGKSPKAPKFSFPSNTVKPDLPSDPENTSFTVTDPEVWVHRPLVEDEDEGVVHVCPSFPRFVVFALLLLFSLVTAIR